MLLKLNIKETESEHIIETFGKPEGFPTFYLVNPDGSLKESWSGYSKDSFLTKTTLLLELPN